MPTFNPSARTGLFRGRGAAIVAIALAAGIAAAAAQTRPGPGSDGNRDDRDPVTGYPCVNNCDVLRIPEANCICVKQNPAETRVDRLELMCSTRERGQWVACPVKPRYGISVEFQP